MASPLVKQRSQTLASPATSPSTAKLDQAYATWQNSLSKDKLAEIIRNGGLSLLSSQIERGTVGERYCALGTLSQLFKGAKEDLLSEYFTGPLAQRHIASIAEVLGGMHQRSKLEAAGLLLQASSVAALVPRLELAIPALVGLIQDRGEGGLLAAQQAAILTLTNIALYAPPSLEDEAKGEGGKGKGGPGKQGSAALPRRTESAENPSATPSKTAAPAQLDPTLSVVPPATPDAAAGTAAEAGSSTGAGPADTAAAGGIGRRMGSTMAESVGSAGLGSLRGGARLSLLPVVGPDEYKARMVGRGAVEALVAHLGAGPNRLTECAALLLRALGPVPPAPACFLAAGGPQRLASLLRRSFDIADVAALCSCLCVLAADYGVLQQLLAAGTAPSLARRLALLAKNATASPEGEAKKKSKKKEKLPPGLVGVLRSVTALLRILTLDDTARLALAASPPALQAITRLLPTARLELRDNLAGILWNLSMDPIVQRQLAELGAPHHVTAVLPTSWLVSSHLVSRLNMNGSETVVREAVPSIA